MKRLLCCSLFLAGLAVVGCGGGDKLHQVEGTVTIDNQPLEGATVTFTNGSVSSSGLSTASGKFKLMTAGKEGAPAGTYKVTVSKQKLKSGSASPDPIDPTKAMSQQAKETMVSAGGPGGKMKSADAKSDIPERYKQTGSLPDQTIPPSGAITVELSSKSK